MPGRGVEGWVSNVCMNLYTSAVVPPLSSLCGGAARYSMHTRSARKRYGFSAYPLPPPSIRTLATPRDFSPLVASRRRRSILRTSSRLCYRRRGRSRRYYPSRGLLYREGPARSSCCRCPTVPCISRCWRYVDDLAAREGRALCVRPKLAARESHVWTFSDLVLIECGAVAY